MRASVTVAFLVAIVLGSFATLTGPGGAVGQNEPPGRPAADPPSMEKADELFEEKHYKEAAAAYAAVVEAEGERWHRAAERVVMCRLRLQLFDEAIEAALDYVKRTAGTPQEARAERLTGHLYMLLPHWGTRSGGEFHRAEHRQGIRLHSWQYDKRHAVRHME
ncbi:MAG: hypothetical protein R6X33_02515, partial [Candidatus Brocadiia bacterium]